MKKGLTYVDWAISIGLFIIYLIVLLIIFSPGITQDYNAEHLTEMVQRNLKEDAYKDMTRVPVYVDTTGSGCSGSCKVDLSPLNINPNWGARQTFLVDEDFQNVDFELNPGSSLKINYNHFINPGITIFWLYYFEDRDVVNPGVICNNDCFGIDEISYTVGVEEKISGFYGEALSDLVSRDLKDKWDYPASRDFSFEVCFLSDPNNCPYTYNPNQVETVQEEVYVMQWSDWLLDENTGGRTAVTVKVMVW